MIKLQTVCVAGILVFLASGTFSNAESWNRFRGPNGSGVAVEVKPPVQLHPETLAWNAAVPRGLSSPIVSRGKVFLTGLEDERLVTLALDASTGRQLWRRAAPPVPIEAVHSFNGPTTPTPCADSERVYAFFGSYGLICYDLEGRELWKKPIPTPKNLYGTASSPILHRDNLILVLDSDANLPESRLSQSRVIALNKDNGALVWETPRPLQRSGWSTPIIWDHGTNDELVVLGSGRICGYDPRTGYEKWFVTGFARETIVVPVAGNGLVYASSAMGGIANEALDPEPLWKAMLHFDANGDGRIANNEMTEHFTFPLRPELPPSHPGFGIPVPSDPEKRKARQHAVFDGIDKDRDGFWTHAEFAANLGAPKFKPWLAAIRAGGAGDVTETHIAWTLTKSIPELPSPIWHQDRLYLVRNGGILTAVNAATGRILYDERLGAGGQYSASPVIGNDHLYLLSNNGVVSVVKTGDQFELVHQQDLGEAIFVTAAIDAETLYVRTESHVKAFRAR